jgi:transcriptional regulator with XRE-family HTH domain
VTESGSSYPLTDQSFTRLREVRTLATPREQLADVLKQARLGAGYESHAALAKKLNVSRSLITKAENAAHSVPSDALLAAWAGLRAHRWTR